MTHDEAVALVMKVQEKAERDEFDFDECTEAARALIEVGIVIEDADGNFRPNLKRLQECPKDVRTFISGMMVTNGFEVEA